MIHSIYKLGIWTPKEVKSEMYQHLTIMIMFEKPCDKEQAFKEAGEILSRLNEHELLEAFNIVVLFALETLRFGIKPLHFNMLQFLRWLKGD